MVEAETGDFVLTFQDGVQDSLFDLGVFYHIGSHLSEDELPWSRFKAVPVVFDYRHGVLKKQIIRITLRLILHFVFLSIENKAITLTCSLRMIWRTLGFISCSPKDTTLLAFSETLLQATSR